MRKILLISIIFTALSFGAWQFSRQRENSLPSKEEGLELFTQQENEGGPGVQLHPMAIEAMRQREYPGSELVIEQTLSPGSNYNRFIASYKSEGLKIYGLLTVPQGEKPPNGRPAIIFNHGYIPPEQYVTTQRYEDYVDGFARNDYIVFKPDYRGHGNSEGKPEGGYFSTAYTVDVLNALASVKRMGEVDPEKIGMWGHSMGGSITLRAMVISEDIKVGVIWAGVVGSYEDIFYNWRRASRWVPSNREIHEDRSSRQSFIERYGEPRDNPEFWNSLSALNFVSDISGPVQLHHGTGDAHVPIEFSEKLNGTLGSAEKEVEFYTYDGADHNLSGSAFGLAMDRSVEFFDKYLKE